MYLLKSVFNFFTLEKNLNILYLTVLIFSVLVSIIFITLSIKLKNFNKKAKLWLKVSHVISLSIGVALSTSNTFFIVGYVFIFCLDLVTLAVINSFDGNKYKITSQQKEFVEFIDNEIKKETDKPALKPLLDKIVINQPREEKVQQQKPDIDFSHVSGILERLDYFPLSTGDKKQVNNLRANLMEAQNGTVDFDIKRRINDGLSDLLKIMSKYGV